MAKLARLDWAVLGASLALAVFYGAVSPGWYENGVSHYALAALKASGIALLAGVAIAHGSRLLAAGLMFGAIGDALLALDTDATFLAGAASFLLGHLCYIALFLRAGIGVGETMRTPWRLAAIATVALASVGVTAVLVPRESALFASLCVYTGVLTLMTLSSFTLPSTRWVAMLGAVLFFISDGFVASNMFHPIDAPAAAFWSSFAGWMIYWAGQAGLCVGALGLHRPRAAP